MPRKTLQVVRALMNAFRSMLMRSPHLTLETVVCAHGVFVSQAHPAPWKVPPPALPRQTRDALQPPYQRLPGIRLLVSTISILTPSSQWVVATSKGIVSNPQLPLVTLPLDRRSLAVRMLFVLARRSRVHQSGPQGIHHFWRHKLPQASLGYSLSMGACRPCGTWMCPHHRPSHFR